MFPHERDRLACRHIARWSRHLLHRHKDRRRDELAVHRANTIRAGPMLGKEPTRDKYKFLVRPL